MKIKNIGSIFSETGLLILLVLLYSSSIYSQTKDSTEPIHHFSGVVTITNNGISLIPTFSLGKPAGILGLSMGNQKFSFEPEFRFALEGKPWSFILWSRYKLLSSNKFTLGIGAHPAFIFKTISTVTNGSVKDIIVSNRYVATEFAPNYYFSKNMSVGVYYLYSHGLDEDAIQNTHFLTINANFSNIKVSKKLLFKVNPQFYYLQQDGKGGYYFTSAFTIAKMNFPIVIQSIINKTLGSDIQGSKDFVWNASIIYSFNNTYVKHR